MLDWTEMCRIEPKLNEVEEVAKALGEDWTYHNYETVKNMLYPLVGWESGNEELGSSEAWDIAIGYLGQWVCP